MGDGPSTAAKWNKYSIGEDGKLQRKAEFCKKVKPKILDGVDSIEKAFGFVLDMLLEPSSQKHAS